MGDVTSDGHDVAVDGDDVITRNDAHAVATHYESDDVIVACHDAECNGLQPTTTITNDANSNATSVVTIAVQSLPLDATTATTTTIVTVAIIPSRWLLGLSLK